MIPAGGRWPNDAGRLHHDEDEAEPVGRVIEVDAFRADCARRRPEPVVAAAPEPVAAVVRKPTTLAEVQAQIAAEARTAPSRWTAPEPSRPQPEPAKVEAVAEPVRMETIADAARSEPVQSEPVRAEQPPVEQPPVEQPRFERRKDARTSSRRSLRAPVEAPSAPALLPPAFAGASLRASILSEPAERKVAAAFGELSEAFAAH